MTAPRSEPLEAEVAAAIGALEAAGERPYYDPEGDADARRRYYAALDTSLDPVEFYRSLSALLE